MYLSIGLIALYILIVKAVAYFAWQRSRATVEDYYIASRGLGGFLLFATMLATIVNGMVVTSTPAHVIEGGILFLQFYITLTISYSLFFVIGPRVLALARKHGVMTHGELLQAHFGYTPLKYLATVVAILSLFPFLAVQMMAVGKIFAEATNGAVSFEIAVLVLACSVGIYLIFGGCRAVVWTDALQGVVFLAILIGTAIAFTYWAGGLSYSYSNLYRVIPEKMQFNSQNVPLFLDRVLSWSFAFFFWPHIFQRCFMTDDVKRLKRVTVWNAATCLFVLTLAMIIGITSASVLHSEVVDHDKIVAQMYLKYFPAGAALIVLTAFAAGMSTIDSCLLSLSSILSRDLVRKNIGLSEESKFNYSRLVSLFVLILICVFVLSDLGRGAIAPLTTVGAAFATLFLWPFLGVCYFKNCSGRVAFWAMLLGFIAIVTVQYTQLGMVLPVGSATIGFFTGLLTFIIGSSIRFLPSLTSKFVPI